MTHPSIHIQIAPTAVPSTPSWLGEVAVLAHVFNQFGLQKAIEERVRFARARMGDYEVIDFVVMLIGYAVSGERTLQAFSERLLPFAEPFMALFGRANLPHPATLSRDLSALDQAPVEALRTLFQKDLVARSTFASPPGGVWDRQGQHFRRRWVHLLHTQTVLFAFGPVPHVEGVQVPQQEMQTRAQRAHWRLSWKERLARNARPLTAPPLEVTLHGLPVTFAQVFRFDVVTAA